MFAKQNAFDDFYNSMKDDYEPNEGFGREIKHFEAPSKPFKKVVSVEGFNNNQSSFLNIKKSSSTNGFDENDNNSHMCNNSRLSYINEDNSFLSSPYGSQNSLSSHVSNNTAMARIGNFQSRDFQYSKSKNITMNKKINVSESDFKTKFKTEVCKYWAQNGTCQFGDSCAFAHGKAEIRQKNHISTNYKTKRCVQFHENGICPYGTRCQFVHTGKVGQSFSSNNLVSYAQELECAEVWCHGNNDCLCSRRKNKSRLPYLVKLSSDNLAGLDHEK